MVIQPTSAWRDTPIELILLVDCDATDQYVAWLNDPAINRFLESRFVTHTIESTRIYIEGCRASANTLLFGINHDDYGHVGNIKLDINRVHSVGEVGILIGNSQVHGQGIGSRAISMVVEIARQQLQLRKLSAGCYSSNKGSERAFIKAGFGLEGTRPAHFLLDDEPEALTLMGLML